MMYIVLNKSNLTITYRELIDGQVEISVKDDTGDDDFEQVVGKRVAIEGINSLFEIGFKVVG